MIRFALSAIMLCLVSGGVAVALEEEAAVRKPLTPSEAVEMTGEKIVVRMKVQSAKDRLEKHGFIYLDSEEDFKSEKNFAVVITRQGAADLKKQGITDLLAHFRNKTIEAEGTVKEVDGIPRIEISEAKHLRVVERKDK